MKTRDRPPLGRALVRCSAAPLLAALLAVSGAVRAEAGSTAAQVAFTEGVLEFDEGDNEEAARLFAEAVENDPDAGTFLHWLGLAELRLGRAAEAMAHLEASLKADCPPAAGRARVKADLRRAREALAGGTGAALAVAAPNYRPEWLCLEKPALWQGSVAFASGWDSNPEQVTEKRPFTLPGEVSPGEVPTDAASSLDVEAGLRPFSGRRGWSLGLDLSGHQSKYQEEDDLDLTFVEGAASLGWGGDPRGALEGPLGVLPVPAGAGRIAFLLQAGSSQAWLSGDRYRGTNDLAASLFVYAIPATATRVGVSWGDRNFSDSGEGSLLLRPSGEELTGSVEQWIFLGRPDRSLRLAAAAGRYDSSRAFERTFREWRAAATLPLAPRWLLHLMGEVRDDDYRHRESNLVGGPLAPPRRDTTWRASATAVWRATDRLSWSLRASHARRTSNVEIPQFGVPLLDYERTNVSLGGQWHF